MLKLNLVAAVALFAMVGCSDDTGDGGGAGGMASGGSGGGAPMGGMGGMATGGMPGGGSSAGGAPGGAGGGGAAEVSYMKDIEPIFTSVAKGQCALCHLAGSTATKLILTAGAGFESLKQPSAQVTMALVGATSAESYLYHKVAGTHDGIERLPEFMGNTMGPNGGKMPAKGLDPADVELIKKWIDGGAKP